MSRMLLERLRWPAPGGTTSVRPDPEDPVELRESIRRNLERILNSRQGLCSLYPVLAPDHPNHMPEYGLPDVVELVSLLPDGRWEIEQKIQRVIEAFEPRLRKKSVRVRYLNNSDRVLCACFHITAAIETRRGPRDVRFETEVGLAPAEHATGQVKVECL